jgi:hypothetical protein
MTPEMKSLYRFGAISFIGSGSLFLIKSVLEWMIGPTPSNGSEILVWAASAKLLLAMTSEVFFFAVMFLVPAVIALYASLAPTHRVHAIVGCGILGVTIPVLSVLAIVHGRLMYPVYDIQAHTPDIAEFVVAMYYGGLHSVAVLFAVATFVLSLAMWRAYGRNIAYLGFATAALDVVGSYPWATGSLVWLVSGIFFRSLVRRGGRAPLQNARTYRRLHFSAHWS